MRQPSLQHTCVDCHNDFLAHQKNQVRCPDCQYTYRISRNGYKYNRVCIDCGEDFRSKNGRAQRCDYCWHNANCKVCGKHFERKSQTKVHCSERCSAYSKADYYHDGNYIPCLKRDRFACRKCGSETKLHVHHIDHSGGENVKKGLANNNLDNLITFCESCHSAVHSFVDTYLYKTYIKDVYEKVNEFIGDTP